MASDQIQASGRRKTSVASVWLSPGQGKWKINGKEITLRSYLTRDSLVAQATEPIRLTNMGDKFNILCRTSGGGLSGQAGAIRLALARALVKIYPELHKQMKSTGLLTRDSRMVERKKYGLVKARKRFQFSKR